MNSPMDRRQFLRRTGVLAASAGSAALLGAAAGCTRSPAAAPPTAPTTLATTGPATGSPNWAELAQTLSGTVVLPADPIYANAKLLFNEQFDRINPAAIGLCSTPGDVQRCVDFARRHGVPVAARSGGHSYGGYSLTSGLVIDVTQMDRITVSPRGSSATIGAGARLIDVYDTLGNAGVLLPGGSCPTVGIAGLTLGGGIGVFDRLFGLTCDNLRSLEMVTADGRLVTASATEQSDLFWACRGGGGGNFGIVTSFDFGVHPIPADIALFTLEWPWAAAADVLGSWQQWIPTTPNELWSNCQLSASASSLSLRVSGVFAGTTSALATALGPLLSAVGSSPTYQFTGPESYLDAMFIEAGCEGLSVGECHLPTQTPDGTLSRSAYAAKSTFVVDPLGSNGIEAAITAIESSQQIAPGIGASFLFDSYGGAINAVGPTETAFVHRDALAGIQMIASWGSGAEPNDAASWLATAAADLAPFTSGAYQNYIDPTLSDWQQAYYGDNLPRLVKVKAKVDPDDFFHFAQSIPTTLSART
jgi:FAD/FMN-containing dehydrogenase